MGSQGWVDVIARWLHIVSIVAWAGGSLFLLVALKPAARAVGSNARPVVEAALLRFRNLVSAATLLVLLSGFAMLGVRISYVGFGGLGPRYHLLFGIKFLLAMTLIGLAHASYARVSRWAADEQVGPPPIIAPRLTIAVAILVMFLGVLLHHL
ncbi:MAG: hypothetical protein ACE5HV_00620 [Acidobacteriota bacterium]